MRLWSVLVAYMPPPILSTGCTLKHEANFSFSRELGSLLDLCHEGQMTRAGAQFEARLFIDFCGTSTLKSGPILRYLDEHLTSMETRSYRHGVISKVKRRGFTLHEAALTYLQHRQSHPKQSLQNSTCWLSFEIISHIENSHCNNAEYIP